MKKKIVYICCLLVLITFSCNTKGSKSSNREKEVNYLFRSTDIKQNIVNTVNSRVCIQFLTREEKKWRANLHSNSKCGLLFSVIGKESQFQIKSTEADYAMAKVTFGKDIGEMQLSCFENESVQLFHTPLDTNLVFDIKPKAFHDSVLQVDIDYISEYQLSITFLEAQSSKLKTMYLVRFSQPVEFLNSHKKLKNSEVIQFRLVLPTDNKFLVSTQELNSSEVGAKNENINSNLYNQIELRNRKKWKENFEKIEVKGGDPRMRKLFYALLHSVLASKKTDSYGNLLKEILGVPMAQEIRIDRNSFFLNDNTADSLLEVCRTKGILVVEEEVLNVSKAKLLWTLLGVVPEKEEGIFRLCAPYFSEAKLHLVSSKIFTIEGKNFPARNRNCNRITERGELLKKRIITKEEVLEGRKLVFHMTK